MLAKIGEGRKSEYITIRSEDLSRTIIPTPSPEVPQPLKPPEAKPEGPARFSPESKRLFEQQPEMLEALEGARITGDQKVFATRIRNLYDIPEQAAKTLIQEWNRVFSET